MRILCCEHGDLDNDSVAMYRCSNRCPNTTQIYEHNLFFFWMQFYRVAYMYKVQLEGRLMQQHCLSGCFCEKLGHGSPIATVLISDIAIPVEQ